MRHILLFLSFCFASYAQVSLEITAVETVRDAQWYSVKVCQSHNLNPFQIAGESILNAAATKLFVLPSAGYQTPVHRRLLVLPDRHPAPVVWGSDLVLELAKGTCQTGLLLGKPQPGFAPVTVMVDPPYMIPRRTTRR